MRGKSVVVFDEFVLEKQDKVRDCFTRDLHKSFHLFHNTQIFSNFPKQLVKENTIFLCLFKEENSKHEHDEFVRGDISFDKFRYKCSKCWEEYYAFFTFYMVRKSERLQVSEEDQILCKDFILIEKNPLK
jgi:hypothetical protein